MFEDDYQKKYCPVLVRDTTCTDRILSPFLMGHGLARPARFSSPPDPTRPDPTREILKIICLDPTRHFPTVIFSTRPVRFENRLTPPDPTRESLDTS